MGSILAFLVGLVLMGKSLLGGKTFIHAIFHGINSNPNAPMWLRVLFDDPFWSAALCVPILFHQPAIQWVREVINTPIVQWTGSRRARRNMLVIALIAGLLAIIAAEDTLYRLVTTTSVVSLAFYAIVILAIGIRFFALNLPPIEEVTIPKHGAMAVITPREKGVVVARQKGAFAILVGLLNDDESIRIVAQERVFFKPPGVAGLLLRPSETVVNHVGATIDLPTVRFTLAISASVTDAPDGIDTASAEIDGNQPSHTTLTNAIQRKVRTEITRALAALPEIQEIETQTQSLLSEATQVERTPEETLLRIQSINAFTLAFEAGRSALSAWIAQQSENVPYRILGGLFRLQVHVESMVLLPAIAARLAETVRELRTSVDRQETAFTQRMGAGAELVRALGELDVSAMALEQVLGYALGAKQTPWRASEAPAPEPALTDSAADPWALDPATYGFLNA